jgi:hypothetical protein
MWGPDWSEETSAQDDIRERYAGEHIPPFDFDPGVDPWTGEPLTDKKPLLVLLTPDI